MASLVALEKTYRIKNYQITIFLFYLHQCGSETSLETNTKRMLYIGHGLRNFYVFKYSRSAAIRQYFSFIETDLYRVL